MSFLPVQGFRNLRVLVAATVIVTLLFTFGLFKSDVIERSGLLYESKTTEPFAAKGRNSSNAGHPLHVNKGEPPAKKKTNSTLDFQEIIYLSMKYRWDRQDQMSLITAVAGLKLSKMIPGVKGTDFDPKGKPGQSGQEEINLPSLGIWRAHANAWKYMIDNDIESAFIVEDDIDFDVNLREIMGNVQYQLKYNNSIRWGRGNEQEGWDEGENCPYGCDWDVLYAGQCTRQTNMGRLDLNIVYEDVHSPKLATLNGFAQAEMKHTWNMTESENKRVIAPTFSPVCLMGYGVSRMGAMRLLYLIGGWKPFSMPVDLEMMHKAIEGKISGYTIMPPLMTPYRIGGSQDSDNDQSIHNQPVQVAGPENGKTEGIKTSVRKYMEGYFKKDYWGHMTKNHPKPNNDDWVIPKPESIRLEEEEEARRKEEDERKKEEEEKKKEKEQQMKEQEERQKELEQKQKELDEKQKELEEKQRQQEAAEQQANSRPKTRPQQNNPNTNINGKEKP